MGAAVPSYLIHIPTWEALRTALLTINGVPVRMTFSEIAAQDAKDWAESQILRPLGILPYVNQSGQYSGRAITQPAFARTAAWSSAFRMEPV